MQSGKRPRDSQKHIFPNGEDMRGRCQPNQTGNKANAVKASEHDLREGSKPEVRELLELEKSATPGPWVVGHTVKREYHNLGDWYETAIHVGSAETRGNALATVSMGGPGALRHSAEEVEANANLIVAMRNQLAAILEENQNLRGMYEEQMRLKDEYKELMRAAEAENQRLAKERDDERTIKEAEKKILIAEVEQRKDAEAKLGKMREALEALRKDAVVLSQEYLDTVARGKSDEDTIQGWDLGRWKRALKAYEQAGNALAD